GECPHLDAKTPSTAPRPTESAANRPLGATPAWDDLASAVLRTAAKRSLTALGPRAPASPGPAMCRIVPRPRRSQPTVLNSDAGYGRRSPEALPDKIRPAPRRRAAAPAHDCQAVNRRLLAATPLPRPRPASGRDRPGRSHAFPG